jgi:hypothetical protein
MRQQPQQRRQQRERQGTGEQGPDRDQIAQVTERRHGAEVHRGETGRRGQGRQQDRPALLVQAAAQGLDRCIHPRQSLPQHQMDAVGDGDGDDDDRRDRRRCGQYHPGPAGRTQSAGDRQQHDRDDRQHRQGRVQQHDQAGDHERQHQRQEHGGVVQGALAERMIHGDDAAQMNPDSWMSLLGLPRQLAGRGHQARGGDERVALEDDGDGHRHVRTVPLHQTPCQLGRGPGDPRHPGPAFCIQRRGILDQRADLHQIAVGTTVRMIERRIHAQRERQLPGCLGELLEHPQPGFREGAPGSRIDDEHHRVRRCEDVPEMLEGPQLRIILGEKGAVAGIELETGGPGREQQEHHQGQTGNDPRMIDAPVLSAPVQVLTPPPSCGQAL